MRQTLILLALWAMPLMAQDEWDIPAAEPKVEWSGNLDVKYTLLRFSASSPMARLQFFGQQVPATASQSRLEPYLNASYTTQDLEFRMRLHGTYYDDRRSGIDLFEAYARYNPSFQTSLQAGRSVYNWGKGYAFNPVGFVNPVKDPENPELAQAGLLSAHAEYFKSFSSGVLQAFSALVVVVPPSPELSDRFADLGDTDVAVRLTALIWDTDVDVMTYQSPVRPDRYGFDVSRNLLENLEMHVELSMTPDARRTTISNGLPLQTTADVVDLLAGIRFLSSTNTTIIAEYYRQGGGLDESEFGSYRSYLLTAASAGTPAAVQQALQTSQAFFRTSTLMREYVYLKVSQPEPFDMLYLTPAIFAIMNVDDGSFLLSAPISYRPATNVEFIVWPSLLAGGDATEFGSRQARQRLEFWMRAYF